MDGDQKDTLRLFSGLAGLGSVVWGEGSLAAQVFGGLQLAEGGLLIMRASHGFDVRHLSRLDGLRQLARRPQLDVGAPAPAVAVSAHRLDL